MRTLDGHYRYLTRDRETSQVLGDARLSDELSPNDVNTVEIEEAQDPLRNLHDPICREEYPVHDNVFNAPISGMVSVGIVESSVFMRECIERSFRTVFSGHVTAYATVDDLLLHMQRLTISFCK